MSTEKEVVLYNPFSGKGKGAKLGKRFEELGCSIFDITAPDFIANVNNLLNAEKDSTSSILVILIVGGDGTYSTVIDDIRKQQAELAAQGEEVFPVRIVLIPAGQESVMARESGFSFNIDPSRFCSDDFLASLEPRPLSVLVVKAGDIKQEAYWLIEAADGKSLGMSVLGWVERLRKIPIISNLNKYASALLGAAEWLINVRRMSPVVVESESGLTPALGVIAISSLFPGYSWIEFDRDRFPGGVLGLIGPLESEETGFGEKHISALKALADLMLSFAKGEPVETFGGVRWQNLPDSLRVNEATRVQLDSERSFGIEGVLNIEKSWDPRVLILQKRENAAKDPGISLFKLANKFDQCNGDYGATVITPLYKRKDKGSGALNLDNFRIFIFGKRVYDPTQENGCVSFTTFPSSPHTPERIESHFLGDSQVLPPHLVVWWMRQESSEGEFPIFSRASLQDVAEFLELKRRDFAKVIETQIREMLQRGLAMNLFSQDNVHIYGLSGHTPVEDRIRLGASAGMASNENGHLHISSIDREKYQKEAGEISPLEHLRMIGLFNQEIFARFGSDIEYLSKLVLGDFGKRVAIESKYRSAEELERRFCEYLSIRFLDSTSFEEAFLALTKLTKFFSGIYSTLRSGYLDYLKVANSTEEYMARERIFNSLIEHFSNFDIKVDEYTFDLLNRLIDFSLSFSPTYAQLEVAKEPFKSEPPERLERKIKKYQKRQQRLSEIQEKFVRRWGEVKGEALFQFVRDMTLNPEDDNWKTIHTTFPENLPFAYEFVIDIDKFKREESLDIVELRLYPRLPPTKGIVEDKTQRILRRR